MKCQFCAKKFRNHDELQIHQVGDCQAIEAGGRAPSEDKQSSVTQHKLHTTEMECVTRKNATSTIPPAEIGKTIVTNNYRLNELKALQKKNNACSRDPYNIQEHTNNVVITLNTGTFEYFSNSLKQYLKSCSRYILKIVQKLF